MHRKSKKFYSYSDSNIGIFFEKDTPIPLFRNCVATIQAMCEKETIKFLF